MNLIMSDVEETIMLVDAESVANGQGVVNVYRLFQTIARADLLDYTGGKTKNGDAVCTRRWSYPRTLLVIAPPSFSIDRCTHERYRHHREHKNCLLPGLFWVFPVHPLLYHYQ